MKIAGMNYENESGFCQEPIGDNPETSLTCVRVYTRHGNNFRRGSQF